MPKGQSLDSDIARRIASQRPTQTFECHQCGVVVTKRLSRNMLPLCPRCRNAINMVKHKQNVADGLTLASNTHPLKVKVDALLDKLNTTPDSPYCGYLKSDIVTGKGKLQPTVITPTLKALFKPKGVFTLMDLDDVEVQYALLKDYFNIFKVAYGAAWHDLSNPFIYSAGFNAAIRFLQNYVVSDIKGFSLSRVSKALKFNTPLLKRAKFKYIVGKDSETIILKYLNGELCT